MQIIVLLFEVVFFSIWGLITCFLVFDELQRLFGGRKPSKRFIKLKSKCQDSIGVHVVVGGGKNRNPLVWGYYSPMYLYIWCRKYNDDVLWHELTHALQDLFPEYRVDAKGLRLLLLENGLRCWFLPIFLLLFNILFTISRLLRMYKKRSYNRELLAYFCQYTRAGKKLVYRKIASL